MNPAIQEAVTNKDISFLAKALFPNTEFAQFLTKTQCDFIRAVVYKEYPRIIISASTQWGKTAGAGVAVGLISIFNKDKKIALLAPSDDQSRILRNFVAELTVDSNILSRMVPAGGRGIERLKQEASKKRLTFTNNMTVQNFSTEGEAYRLMGEGGFSWMFLDERDLINPLAEPKINRMISAKSEDSVTVELLNPWGKGEKARKHWDEAIDYYKIIKLPKEEQVELLKKGRFVKFHVNWQTAVAEDRMTKEYVDMQRADLTPMEFQILYDSVFPDESEDQLIKRSDAVAGIDRKFTIYEELKSIEQKLKYKDLLTDKMVKKLEEELKLYTKVISCDPADKGKDWTVILWGVQKGNDHQIVGHYSEAKSNPIGICGKLMEITKNFIGKQTAGAIMFDEIGLGKSLYHLTEKLQHGGYNNVRTVPCNNAEGALNNELYRIKRDENYFRLADIFREGLIDIPNHPTLLTQLVGIKWKLSSTGKRQIESKKPGEKSPDWADALMYFTWKDSKKLAYFWG